MILLCSREKCVCKICVLYNICPTALDSMQALTVRVYRDGGSGNNVPGAESLGASKYPNNFACTFSNTVHLLPRHAKLVSCPGAMQPRYVPLRQKTRNHEPRPQPADIFGGRQNNCNVLSYCFRGEQMIGTCCCKPTEQLNIF